MRVGPANETIGTTVLELATQLGMHPELLRLIRVLQESRMGFYIHGSRKGKLTVLRTSLPEPCAVRSFRPAPVERRANSGMSACSRRPSLEVRNTSLSRRPYIVLHPGLPEWREYFRRTIPAGAPIGEYERHMKFGPTRQYWSDLVFEAYVKYRTEAVHLAGLPDVPEESRPHSKVSETNGWEAPGFIC